jgi:hypothetical protein
MEFRSSWEANTARVFNLIGLQWRYEPKRFYLTDTISYLPDFELLTQPNKWNAKWIEVKGLWNRGDKRKLKLFMQLFPEETLHVIAGKEYRQMAKIFKPLIKNWEFSVSRRNKMAKRKKKGGC